MEHLEIFPKKLAKLVKFKLSKKFPKNSQNFFLVQKMTRFVSKKSMFHSIPQEESQCPCIHQPTNRQRKHQKAPKKILKKNSTTI
jgi:hypothetical protein